MSYLESGRSGAAVTAKQGWYIRFIETFVDIHFHGINKMEASGFISAYQKLAHDQETALTKKLIPYIEEKVGIACKDTIFIDNRRNFILKHAREVLSNPANKEDELYKILLKIVKFYANDSYTNILFAQDP